MVMEAPPAHVGRCLMVGIAALVGAIPAPVRVLCIFSRFSTQVKSLLIRHIKPPFDMRRKNLILAKDAKDDGTVLILTF